MRIYVSLFTLILLGCSGGATDPVRATDTGGEQVESDVGGRKGTDLGGLSLDQGIDVSTPDASPPPEGWSDRARIGLGPRQESAVVALDGLVWVLGGFNEATQMVPYVESYDPATDTWTRRADFPVPAHHMNAAVVDGRIWVTGFLVGGFAADGRTFVYDPTSDAWTPDADMPAGRARGASATGAIEGKIYVAGGLAGSAVALFDVFDPVAQTWTPLPDVPRSVDHAAFTAVGDTFVVASGRAGSIGSVSEQVHRFVPADGQWTAGAPIPTPRGGMASAALAGKLYVFGGEGNAEQPSGVFAEVEAYDVAADRWETLEPMPTPRHGLGAAAVDGTIYLPGGAPTQAFDAVDDHQAFRP